MELKSIEKSKVQVPLWKGNLQYPDSERIIVYWKSFPKAGDISRYKSFKFDSIGNTVVSYNDSLLILEHLDHIDNLKIGKEIKTPHDLLSHDDLRLESFISELRNYALSKVEELPEGEGEASE